MARPKGPALDRDAVVHCAVELVTAEGAEALRAARVAELLGIKPPSIYNHVGKGDALLRAVSLEANRRLLAAFKDTVREVFDPKEQLRVLAHTTRQWALEYAGLYQIMARVEPDNASPDFGPIYRDMIDLFVKPFGQLGVGPEDRIHAVRGLRSSIHGFVLLELSGQFQLQEDIEQSFAWLVERVIRS